MMENYVVSIVAVGLVSVLFNILLVGLNLKLFTEFVKQRMQEARKT